MLLECVLFLSFFPFCTSAPPTLFLRSGKCSTPPVEKDFDPHRMMGQWYEISRFPSKWEFGRCIQVSYSTTDDGKTIKMRWEQILDNGSINYADSVAAMRDPSEPSKLSMSFTKPIIPWETPFWIVTTDYDNYALIYSCYPYFHKGLRRSFQTEFAWIMYRKREISSSLKRNLTSILTKHNIYANMLIDNDQTRCGAYQDETAHYF